MRALFLPAAIAAFALIAPTLALADDSDYGGDLGDLGPASVATPSTDTTFDLGVDVSDVVNTTAAVRAFIARLPSDTQEAVMGACEHFMEAPATAQNIDTLAFCESAVRG